MLAERHLIARQTIEITARDRKQAEALTARAQATGQALTAAIERALDSLAPPGERVILDRIMLDLGRIDPARFEEQLLARIVPELARVVPPAIDRQSPSTDGAPATFLALLAQFARTGGLPWWAGAGDNPAAAIAHLAARACPPEPIRDLLSHPDAIPRLALQLDDAALEALARLADPAAPPRVAEQVTMLARALDPGTPARARPAVWRAVLQIAAGVSAPIPPARFPSNGPAQSPALADPASSRGAAHRSPPSAANMLPPTPAFAAPFWRAVLARISVALNDPASSSRLMPDSPSDRSLVSAPSARERAGPRARASGMIGRVSEIRKRRNTGATAPPSIRPRLSPPAPFR